MIRDTFRKDLRTRGPFYSQITWSEPPQFYKHLRIRFKD